MNCKDLVESLNSLSNLGLPINIHKDEYLYKITIDTKGAQGKLDLEVPEAGLLHIDDAVEIIVALYYLAQNTALTSSHPLELFLDDLFETAHVKFFGRNSWVE